MVNISLDWTDYDPIPRVPGSPSYFITGSPGKEWMCSAVCLDNSVVSLGLGKSYCYSHITWTDKLSQYVSDQAD